LACEAIEGQRKRKIGRLAIAIVFFMENGEQELGRMGGRELTIVFGVFDDLMALWNLLITMLGTWTR
jgi:hypothetical protein